LARRLVRVFGAIVQVPMLSVFNTRKSLPLRSPIAFQPIGDDHARDVPTPFQQLPKEPLGGCLVAAALHQDIEHRPVLIHGPPEIMALPIDREEHFIQVPLVTRLRASASELIGIRLAEFPTPLTGRLIGDDDPAREQQFFDIAVAEAEPEIEPYRVADDLYREAVILIAVDG
jgi:hypothetical protein